jgi:hypothetical protein
MPKNKATPPVVQRGPGHPAHAPTKVDRDTVSLMVAGGIAQDDIAAARGISTNTLRKHYLTELTTGATALNTIVIIELVKRIKAGDLAAIKWWTQSRMGWSERITVDDGKLADTPMRVIVEFVGDAAPPRLEHAARSTGSRLSDEVRRNVVELVG